MEDTPEEKTPAPKTVAQKLLVRPKDQVFLAGGSAAEHALLGELPAGARVTNDAAGAEAAVVFATSRAALEALLAEHLPSLLSCRAAWIAYPKGNRADINRDSIWALLQERGHALNANVSLGDVWSAVRIKTGA